MKKKLKTELMSLYVLSVGVVFLSAGNAFAACRYGGGTKSWRNTPINCDIAVQMYPISGNYNGTEYDIVVMNGDKDDNRNKLSYRTGKKSDRFNAMFPLGKTDPTQNVKFKYYATRLSKWTDRDKGWHTYGKAFCFSLNKASFRDSPWDYRGGYSIGSPYVRSDYSKSMQYFSGYLKFDPKPQTIFYYDNFEKKYVQKKIDVILSGGTIPAFSCTSDIGNTEDPNNASRWQIWSPEGSTGGVLYDSQYFFLYDAVNYSCTGSPIQPRKCNSQANGNDPTNCLF